MVYQRLTQPNGTLFSFLTDILFLIILAYQNLRNVRHKVSDFN